MTLFRARPSRPVRARSLSVRGVRAGCYGARNGQPRSALQPKTNQKCPRCEPLPGKHATRRRQSVRAPAAPRGLEVSGGRSRCSARLDGQSALDSGRIATRRDVQPCKKCSSVRGGGRNSACPRSARPWITAAATWCPRGPASAGSTSSSCRSWSWTPSTP